MSDRARQLELIEKLRNLARRAAGSAEGKAAARKARELIERYGITPDELKRRAAATQTAPAAAKPKTRPTVPSAAVRPKPPAATITFKAGNLRIRWRL